jgi:predicted RNA binding protein YcfA (HicA-like mRNA interferase family)
VTFAAPLLTLDQPMSARRLKALSGDDLLVIFRRFRFVKHSQRGSHIKLRREAPQGRQTLTIVLHKEIDKGTLLAIFRQALRYIPEAELSPYFFNE